MGTAIAVFHGPFGRAALYRLNKPLAPHAHREGHLVLLLSGIPATVTVDGTAYATGPGRAVAINPWQPHDFQPGDVGAGALFLTLYIAPEWFMTMSRGIDALRFGAPHVPLSAGAQAIIERTADRLASGVERGLADDLSRLMQAAFDASWAIGRAPFAAPRVRDFRIRNALALMHQRLFDACALDRIARDAGMSRPHFYKLFRQNLGVTPNMYLNTLRLEASIDRLVWSHDPVTSIGLDLGFASQASFTRFFVNNVGIAPSDYRRCALVAT
ncbi:AraC family transcriptional regulator [Acuticoccus sp.]|uniref:helix-turn-helix transcriptional regulator n=1 Tax=Acuticoccus sp. TaxID=1904378 RepID=UPI003B5304D5